MSKREDLVDTASDDSFPASDPPSFTPVSGSGNPHGAESPVLDGHSITPPDGRAEELQQHLAAHGIETELRPTEVGDMESLKIIGPVDPEAIQAILDEWER